MTVCPATVKCAGAWRGSGVGGERRGGPVPCRSPLAPDVTVIHEAVLAAVQVQPVAVVTVMLLEPALAAGFVVSGETV